MAREADAVRDRGLPMIERSHTDSAAATQGLEGFPTVGILGGGQLARMLGTAARELGLPTRYYQTDDTGPIAGDAEVFTGAWDDELRLQKFLEGCDVVTLDNEWVELDTIVRLMPEHTRLWPSPETMALVSDKVRQKEHAEARGLPIGPFRVCRDESDLREAAQSFGFPVVVKRPRHSYDGYGNRTANDWDELRAAHEALADDGRVLVEKWVDFVRELAVMVARRPGGAHAIYPVAATLQREHRCEAVEVPAPVSETVTRRAADIARQAAEAYGCVGVVGVELFELADGRILVNEIAPRPHNTGHYTIDACVTSQFENHLRAVLDLPLGDPSLVRPAAAMVNVLGHREGPTSAHTLADALAVPGVRVHVYGKRAIRPGRKVGHVTALGASTSEALTRAYEAAGKLEL
jgi:5-(carboxyamino)imidazole ribonucleotide synthase